MPNNFNVLDLSNICMQTTQVASNKIQPTSHAALISSNSACSSNVLANGSTSSNVKINLSAPSNIITNSVDATLAPNRNFFTLNIGDVFLASLWNTSNSNRIEEGLVTLNSEGEFYTVQELNSCLDALHEVNNYEIQLYSGHQSSEEFSLKFALT